MSISITRAGSRPIRLKLGLSTFLPPSSPPSSLSFSSSSSSSPLSSPSHTTSSHHGKVSAPSRPTTPPIHRRARRVLSMRVLVPLQVTAPATTSQVHAESRPEGEVRTRGTQVPRDAPTATSPHHTLWAHPRRCRHVCRATMSLHFAPAPLILRTIIYRFPPDQDPWPPYTVCESHVASSGRRPL